jgi:hypothetical protein
MDLAREDLDAAVDAGIIDARTRDRLLTFAAQRTAGDNSGPDNESFRLLTGFNDIFVSLACILLLTAVVSLLPGIAAGAGLAGLSWALAEYFTLKRRMALPSILLLLAFVGGVFLLILQLVSGGDHWSLALAQAWGRGQVTAVWAPFAVAGATAAAAAALHWRRFRVPITLAAGAAALAVLLAAITGAILSGRTPLLLAMLVSGLAIFALAMRYDMGDRLRLTRNTDIAFWLHLLAAPLIVHPIFALTGLGSHPIFALTGLGGSGGQPAAALVVLLVYAGLTFVALAIDRRALLVSALVYVLWALQGLFEAGQVAAGFGFTALILGSFLVMLSAAWAGLRRRLLALLPPGWASRLPAPA